MLALPNGPSLHTASAPRAARSGRLARGAGPRWTARDAWRVALGAVALVGPALLGAGGCSCGDTVERAGAPDAGRPDAATGSDGATPDGGRAPDAAGADGASPDAADAATPTSCFATSDCGPTEYCATPICPGEDVIGECVPRETSCDLDFRPVCGCDDRTYDNPCAARMAGVVVRAEGPCAPAPGECTPSSPCTGGAICLGGPLCTDRWFCDFAMRACTDDLATYCGCDGVEFEDSSTCPRRPFAHLGACDEIVSCDPRVTCTSPPPPCAPGLVGRTAGGCFTGECVPIDRCACASQEECPAPSLYTCYTRGTCGPLE